MDARGPTSESKEGIILCIGVVITLSLSTAGQGVLRKEHLLTHITAVTGQRGSRTLFTGSDEGKLNVTFGFGLLDRKKHNHENLKFLTYCFSPTGFDLIRFNSFHVFF